MSKHFPKLFTDEPTKNAMKKIRIKQLLPQLKTRDAAEACMNDLALTINNQRQAIASRDAAVLAINQRYEQSLAIYEKAIAERTDMLRAWAEANPDQFPKDRKSIVFLSGTLGFRTGTPKLALLSRAWTWAKTLLSLKAAPHMQQFIRTKEEIDKEAILALHASTPVPADLDAVLKKHGLHVTQDETFFIEPNLTDTDPTQKQPIKP